MGFTVIIGFYMQKNWVGLIGFLQIALGIYLGKNTIIAFRLYRQYIDYNKRLNVKINYSTNQIIVNTDNQDEIIINTDDITKVDFYYSDTDSKNILYKYQFAVINFNNQKSYKITCFQTDINKLESFCKKNKSRKYKKINSLTV